MRKAPFWTWPPQRHWIYNSLPSHNVAYQQIQQIVKGPPLFAKQPQLSLCSLARSYLNLKHSPLRLRVLNILYRNLIIAPPLQYYKDKVIMKFNRGRQMLQDYRTASPEVRERLGREAVEELDFYQQEQQWAIAFRKRRGRSRNPPDPIEEARLAVYERSAKEYQSIGKSLRGIEKIVRGRNADRTPSPQPPQQPHTTNRHYYDQDSFTTPPRPQYRLYESNPFIQQQPPPTQDHFNSNTFTQSHSTHPQQKNTPSQQYPFQSPQSHQQQFPQNSYQLPPPSQHAYSQQNSFQIAHPSQQEASFAQNSYQLPQPSPQSQFSENSAQAPQASQQEEVNYLRTDSPQNDFNFGQDTCSHDNCPSPTFNQPLHSDPWSFTPFFPTQLTESQRVMAETMRLFHGLPPRRPNTPTMDQVRASRCTLNPNQYRPSGRQ